MICEPSRNVIALGHKGKAQISIKTHGISAHGSAPEKGLNAIYEMAEIIERVEKTNAELMKKETPRGTLVMSQISSISVSLNAVPSECEVYLDRRTVPGETDDDIKREMDQLIAGKKATWEVGTLHRKSWTGLDIAYEPFHAAWKIDLESGRVERPSTTEVCVRTYATRIEGGVVAVRIPATSEVSCARAERCGGKREAGSRPESRHPANRPQHARDQPLRRAIRGCLFPRQDRRDQSPEPLQRRKRTLPGSDGPRSLGTRQHQDAR